jgi:hypothetical protein
LQLDSLVVVGALVFFCFSFCNPRGFFDNPRKSLSVIGEFFAFFDFRQQFVCIIWKGNIYHFWHIASLRYNNDTFLKAKKYIIISLTGLAMSLFGYIIQGELTGKDKQRLETIDDILRAFYNGKHEKIPRKWNDLLAITGLSNAVLSKHLRELIRQGVVKGEVKAPENTMEIFYEYTGKSYVVKGRTPKLKEVTRIHFDKKGKDGIVKIEQGFLKKGKGKSRYFVKEK